MRIYTILYREQWEEARLCGLPQTNPDVPKGRLVWVQANNVRRLVNIVRRGLPGVVGEMHLVRADVPRPLVVPCVAGAWMLNVKLARVRPDRLTLVAVGAGVLSL